jgi:hypothetical protein
MSAREELFECMMPTHRAQYAPGEEDSTNALLDAYRDEILSKLAGEIREKFPDPNPLASIFKPYVGQQIADYIDPED